MTREPRPSKFVQWCLRTLMPKDDADAVIGDLNEEMVRRPVASHGEGPSAFQIEWRAWRYVLALAPAAARMAGRSFWHVLRDAARALRSAPGTTAGIILILTLGISAATVTFSVVDTVVLRPLPFEDDHELVVVGLRGAGDAPSTPGSLSPLHYQTLRNQTTTLHSIAAVVRTSRLTLNASGEPEPLVSMQTTASLFDTLRVPPFIGQTFTADHEVEGNHQVAVISHDLWQRRFGGDPAVVGQSIAVTRTTVLGGITTDESLTVLGVMPRGFTYPMSTQPPPDIWTPHVMRARESITHVEGRSIVQLGSYVSAIGRLRPSASLEQVQSEARTVAASLAETAPELQGTQFHIVPLKETLVGNVRGWMLLVLGAVTVVMLIACVNVANLQLVRATHRARELSIRASLGATRRQLVASLLVESLLLSLIAATLAIVAAVWGDSGRKGRTARKSGPHHRDRARHPCAFRHHHGRHRHRCAVRRSTRVAGVARGSGQSAEAGHDDIGRRPPPMACGIRDCRSGVRQRAARRLDADHLQFHPCDNGRSRFRSIEPAVRQR